MALAEHWALGLVRPAETRARAGATRMAVVDGRSSAVPGAAGLRSHPSNQRLIIAERESYS